MFGSSSGSRSFIFPLFVVGNVIQASKHLFSWLFTIGEVVERTSPWNLIFQMSFHFKFHSFFSIFIFNFRERMFSSFRKTEILKYKNEKYFDVFRNGIIWGIVCKNRMPNTILHQFSSYLKKKMKTRSENNTRSHLVFWKSRANDKARFYEEGNVQTYPK